jgi:hypothetical protein
VVAVTVGVVDTVAIGVVDEVAVGDIDVVAVGDIVGVKVEEGVGSTDGDWVGVSGFEGDDVRVLVLDMLGLGDSLGVGDGVVLAVSVAVLVELRLAPGDAVVDGVLEKLRERDGVDDPEIVEVELGGERQ